MRRSIRYTVGSALAGLALLVAAPSQAIHSDLSADNPEIAWGGSSGVPTAPACDLPANTHLCPAHDFSVLDAGTVVVAVTGAETDTWEVIVYDGAAATQTELARGIGSTSFEAIDDGEYYVYVKPVLVVPGAEFAATATLEPLVEEPPVEEV